jgi:hypothetical protein
MLLTQHERRRRCRNLFCSSRAEVNENETTQRIAVAYTRLCDCVFACEGTKRPVVRSISGRGIYAYLELERFAPNFPVPK